MQSLTMQHLATMQHLDMLDRKVVYYGASWVLSISACVIGVAATALYGH